MQAEVFSALRSPPQGDELQLLSKLHKVWHSNPACCISYRDPMPHADDTDKLPVAGSQHYCKCVPVRWLHLEGRITHCGCCKPQVEQHIRRNALRLNLADRLNGADAPSSDISSEVGCCLQGRRLPCRPCAGTIDWGWPHLASML